LIRNREEGIFLAKLDDGSWGNGRRSGKYGQPGRGDDDDRRGAGATLLTEGVRGWKPFDVEVLAELIAKASRLMATLPPAELDLNPVIIYNDRDAVADARISFTT